MKKLVSKRGFTLAEMLIAVLLLGIVSLMATVMTSAVLNTTVTMKEVAQAEILGSEALDNIQAELRYTPESVNVSSDKKSVTFSHDRANDNCVMTLDESTGKIVLKIKKQDGTIGNDELFIGVSYDNDNLRIYELTFEEDGKSVKATVAVSFNGKVLWRGSVSIRPINDKGVTTEGTTESTTAP